MSEQEQELNLVLTVKEINFVLAALAKAPYEQVEGLVNKIRMQGQAGFAAIQQAQALAAQNEATETTETGESK